MHNNFIKRLNKESKITKQEVKSELKLKMNRGVKLKENQIYIAYIREHRQNIKLAFKKFGYELCNKLNLDYDILREKIGKHDASKYDIEEFDYYRQYFYPADNETPNKDIMNIGWLHHMNFNSHHPEYWILRDGNEIKALPMDNYSIAEMLLDWEAMGIKFKTNTYNWYKENADRKFIFNGQTKNKIDEVIEIFK